MNLDILEAKKKLNRNTKPVLIEMIKKLRTDRSIQRNETHKANQIIYGKDEDIHHLEQKLSDSKIIDDDNAIIINAAIKHIECAINLCELHIDYTDSDPSIGHLALMALIPILGK